MIGDNEHTKKLDRYDQERAKLEPEAKGLPRHWPKIEVPPRPTIRQQLHERVLLMRESLAFSQRCLDAQNERYPEFIDHQWIAEIQKGHRELKRAERELDALV